MEMHKSAPPGDVFPLSAEEFQRISAHIRRLAGIALTPTKKDMVYSRLARRLRALELRSFSEYLARLEGGDGGEAQMFVNALTTNMTSFFREEHHFPILARHLCTVAEHRPVTIWCCASSSGEEPYSIAMTALEALAGCRHQPRILATDIDTRMLELARAGIYPLEELQKVPQERVQRFFLRGEGRHRGFAKVKQELKSIISYRRLNLLDPDWPMRGRFDAIFCRNVLIYFDKETRRSIPERMASWLHPGGLLFLGHSENMQCNPHLYTACGNTVYALRS